MIPMIRTITIDSRSNQKSRDEFELGHLAAELEVERDRQLAAHEQRGQDAAVPQADGDDEQADRQLRGQQDAAEAQGGG